jgi:exosortase/archaeosortase family protein
MKGTPGQTILKAASIPALALGAFSLFQAPFRHFETWVDFSTLHWLGVSGLPWRGRTTILLLPVHSPGFQVAVLPSCSALAPIIALILLALAVPAGGWTRRVGIGLTAAAVVFIGNVIRIDACIAVGLAVGRSSLLLFHNWVGSVFSFVYVLAGFLLMVAMHLPSGRGARPPEGSWPLLEPANS